MKKINKKFISMLLVIILVTGCGCNKQKIKNNSNLEENKIIINQNKEFNKTKIVNNIEISNVNLKYETGISTFTANIINKGTSKKIIIIDIIIKDENKNEIITLKGMIDRIVKKMKLLV